MSQAPQPPTTGPDGSPSGGSRNVWTYLAAGAGIVVLAVVLFLVLRPDDDGESAAEVTPSVQTTTTVETTTEATTEVTTTEQTTTEEVTTTAPADQPQRVVVEVEGGQPVGGIQRAEIELDSEVVFIVRADVSDEVHIHGYDLSTGVAPGQPARIRFRADAPGEFEVELEESAVPIAELVVS